MASVNNKDTKSGCAALDAMYERHQRIWKAFLTHPRLPAPPVGMASINLLTWCDEKGDTRATVHLNPAGAGLDPAYVVYGEPLAPDNVLITCNVDEAIEYMRQLWKTSPGV